MITKALGKGKETQKEDKWKDPSIQDMGKMEQQQGSGSPEGLHGEEIRYFPE